MQRIGSKVYELSLYIMVIILLPNLLHAAFFRLNWVASTVQVAQLRLATLNASSFQHIRDFFIVGQPDDTTIFLSTSLFSHPS